MSASDDLWRAMYGLSKGRLTFRERVRFWIARFKSKRVKPIIPESTESRHAGDKKREFFERLARGIDG